LRPLRTCCDVIWYAKCLSSSSSQPVSGLQERTHERLLERGRAVTACIRCADSRCCVCFLCLCLSRSHVVFESSATTTLFATCRVSHIGYGCWIGDGRCDTASRYGQRLSAMCTAAAWLGAGLLAAILFPVRPCFSPVDQHRATQCAVHDQRASYGRVCAA
jgi:hypothetical protein